VTDRRDRDGSTAGRAAESGSENDVGSVSVGPPLLTPPQAQIKQRIVDYLLAQPEERRPAPGTLRDLRASCDVVLARGTFGSTIGARLSDLVPPDHPLLNPELPLLDLAVALLDPVRDPERYGGAAEHVEARWQQLGAWLVEIGMPLDACHHVVRAIARTARDVSGEEWDSAASSGWAALQLWMQAALEVGVEELLGTAAEPAGAPVAVADPGRDGFVAARSGAEAVAERLAGSVAGLAVGWDGGAVTGYGAADTPSGAALAARPSG
jgi:hypothetical protein